MNTTTVRRTVVTDADRTPEKPVDVAPAPRRAVYHFKIVHIVYYIVGVIDVLLAFRFLFNLLAANPNAGLVSFVNSVSAPLMAPFVAIFPNSAFGSGVFEWPVLLAIIFYLIIAIGIVQLVNVIVARNPNEEM